MGLLQCRAAVVIIAAVVGSASALRVEVGSVVVQRSIQTQLLYSAQLRNEPQVSWLAKFLGQQRLDSSGRHIGSGGLPHTYTGAFDALSVDWRTYLDALRPVGFGAARTLMYVLSFPSLL